MTNALDGPIYLGLFIILFIVQCILSTVHKKELWKHVGIGLGVTVGTAVLASIPFMYHFKSFVTGVAVNCPPSFLQNMRFGPVMLEGAEKCQHSPFWMVWLLWGFFFYCGGYLIYSLINKKKAIRKHLSIEGTQTEHLLIVLFVVSILLIIFPEFFYFKDIYPAHFRSNTMFKLGYQAFIMFSIISGYSIVRAMHSIRLRGTRIFLILLIPQLFLVSVYPLFSVRSYFDSLRTYKGLDGLAWLREQYPDDYSGIRWINKQQLTTHYSLPPVIVEADGESYTDYARISAFTGLPTIIGWPVHEWLWRGTYDVVAPRREDVRTIYTSDDIEITRDVLKRYDVRYIVVGGMEREKYPDMKEDKFAMLGERVFTQGSFSVYAVYPDVYSPLDNVQ